MIYTIGHKENYMKSYRQHEAEGVHLQKLGKRLSGAVDTYPNGKTQSYPDGYEGGYAFETYEDALRGLAEENPQGTWTVFGLDARWGIDTQPSISGWWHNLLVDSDIILVENK